MNNINLSNTVGAAYVPVRGETRTTSLLLRCGIVAGPLYVVVALVQALTRPGFDILRHDVSLLSNGPFGWIQITNFVLTGLLVIAGSFGMRRVMREGHGRTWGPRLLTVYGFGLIAAGIFVVDPMNGFPVGAPASNAVSFGGLMHMVSGGIGFLGLVSSCMVFSRRFVKSGQKGWAATTAATGIYFLLAFFAIASGSGSPLVVLGFWVAVLTSFTWLALVSLRLLRESLTSEDRDVRALVASN